MNFSKNIRQGSYLLALFVLIEFTFFILFRKVNLDEGWYLWASKLVYEGQHLYRDFAYTQTPLLPYIYGLFQSLFGQGLYQGRILSALFGASSGVISVWIVRQHLRARWPEQADRANWAALFCMALFATSFYAICYLVYTATYSLATFLLVCAVASATLFPQNTRAENVRYILATIFISLAIATRMSVVGALPALVLYLLATCRPHNTKKPALIRTLFTIGLTGILSAIILLGPFWLLSGELMLYDIFGFHTDRIPSITRQWYRQLTTLRRSGWIYAIPLALMLISICAGLIRRNAQRVKGWRAWLDRNSLELALTGMIIGPLALHLVPRTTDAYYNTLQFPLLCILASLLVMRNLEPNIPRSAQPVLDHLDPLANEWAPPKNVRFMLGAALLINALIHLFALSQFDLISLNAKTFLPINQVAIVRDAADFLHGVDRNTNQFLTLNTHLALETDLDVPHGYEMSIFSYRPDWTDKESQRYHVINNEMFIADLIDGADAVAITDFDAERFYGKRQQIFDTLTQNYRHAKTIPNFDPQHNNLTIYLPPQFGEPDYQYKFAAHFDNEVDSSIDLLGYDIPNTQYRAGETLDIALYWQASSAVSQPYTAFVQVLNPAGARIAGWDNPPCQRTCPTQSWQPGEILRDEYRIDLPDTLDAGTYLVQIGLYHSDTAELLPIDALSSMDDLATDDQVGTDKNMIGTIVDGRLRLTQIEIR